MQVTGARIRRRAVVRGLVQGVGFRPFAHALAARQAVAGFVTNDARGVLLEVEGTPPRVEQFLRALVRDAPPLAIVEAVDSEAVPVRDEHAFAIVESRTEGERRVLVSPDIATCPDCLAEMLDPADRRFQYPFINCTNCGPRFTIVCGVPYDRVRTTMAGFALCPACAREYADTSNRRFHAEPISCPACGPRLSLVDAGGRMQPGDPLRRTAEVLQADGVVAVKGLGGYHLAARAASGCAVAALRTRKHREDKPFAVMVADVDAARRLAEVDAAAERALTGGRRPIVLVPRRPGAPVAAAVAPGARWLGLMLPYTPLHHLLCRYVGEPFVLTSGNLSDEPIAYDDADARTRLAPIADAFLTHDRPIQVRTDDSVVRTFRGRETVVRRARGYAPQPLLLARPVARPILACGAELKSTFCLVKDRYAFLSPHVGDLHDYAAFSAYRSGIEHFMRLFDVEPAIVAHDLHPDYQSTRHALALEGVWHVGVQHHHAHVAACLADNGETGPAIGVAFDGLGYGTDGTLWGGEFLIADLAGFERVGHLEPCPMPGGTAAIREPWRMAVAYLTAAGVDAGDLAVARRHRRGWGAVEQLVRTRVHSPLTSSAGRLFDAVAAILDVCDAVTYEGQAAVELEAVADPAETSGYEPLVGAGAVCTVSGASLVAAVVDDLRAGRQRATIAARLHNTVARAIVRVCARLRERRGPSVVALTGGVFQNALLLARTTAALESAGFRVLTHHRVPPNDGGISFGQAVVAASRDP